MNKARKKALVGLNTYTKLSEHKPLQAFAVCGEYFGEEADFNEMVAIVEQDWLYRYMIRNGIDEPLEYLQCEYTSDDSYEWYDKAKEDNVVVMVRFC